VIHTDPLAASIPAREPGQPSFGGIPAGLVSCAQLARTPALGRCPPGAQAAVIPAFPLPRGFTRQGTQSDTVWRAAAISPQRLGRLPALALVVSTNGSTAAIERARTRLESAYPGRVVPTTIAELYSHDAVLTGWQQLANVVVLASLAIAGCTLAASVAAGLNERKRPFSLLRLTGAPLRLLRRVVTLETVVPLLAVSVVSIGMGFLAAQLFLKSQLSYSLQPPGIGYYLVVIVGLAASLALIASTMPLLRRITGPETARNE
jgi:predicted lysophospholipase L1 biosynthesis ABC-type transport system permease subunit